MKLFLTFWKVRRGKVGRFKGRLPKSSSSNSSKFSSSKSCIQSSTKQQQKQQHSQVRSSATTLPRSSRHRRNFFWMCSASHTAGRTLDLARATRRASFRGAECGLFFSKVASVPSKRWASELASTATSFGRRLQLGGTTHVSLQLSRGRLCSWKRLTGCAAGALAWASDQLSATSPLGVDHGQSEPTHPKMGAFDDPFGITHRWETTGKIERTNFSRPRVYKERPLIDWAMASTPLSTLLRRTPTKRHDIVATHLRGPNWAVFDPSSHFARPLAVETFSWRTPSATSLCRDVLRIPQWCVAMHTENAWALKGA